MKEEKWRKLFLEKEEDAVELFPEEEEEAVELFPEEEAELKESVLTEEPEEIQETKESEEPGDGFVNTSVKTEEAEEESEEEQKPVLPEESESAQVKAEEVSASVGQEDEDKREQPEEDEPSSKSVKKRSFLRELMSWIMILAVSFAIAFFINEVILINARIVSGSMEKTIMTGDRVMGTRFAYWFSEPERGDIVIFYSPDKSTKTLIKRIIGLPGDRVDIHDGIVYINGEALDEPYLWEEMRGSYGPYQVPQECYFVLGDNRNGSGDSRYWSNPFIKRDEILGKASFIYWPRIEGLKKTG